MGLEIYFFKIQWRNYLFETLSKISNKLELESGLDEKLAGWQSGYAAACKAVYVGSIPALASK